MLQSGLMIADRYEILEHIGSGGMADVYKARCHKLNRFVAIKVLKKEYSNDETFVSKFKIEAQSVAGLTHPNILTVFDVGNENGINYIVMELIEGMTLKQFIEKKKTVSVRDTVSIAVQVGQGIDAAHKKGIVHRDIKPQNIMIANDGKVKVADFGIARAATTDTFNSSVMGSVHYISPERARGGYSDYKGDIYSFGIMLFEMLTGKVPFDGDNAVSVALLHIQSEVPYIRDLDPTMPKAICDIVKKCTAKRTENRYDDMASVVADLRESLKQPDGDFVFNKPASAAMAGETVSISAEEMQKIKNGMAGNRGSAGSHVTSSDTNPIDKRSVHSSVSKSEPETDDDEDDAADEYDDGEGSSMDKLILAGGICLAGILLLVAIYIVNWALGNVDNKSSSSKSRPTAEYTIPSDGMVEVPKIVGMSSKEAKAALNAKGLGYICTGNVTSDLYARGTVITQSLEAGTRVKPNTTVYVTTSNGAENFSLENYVGKKEETAKKLLEELGLKVECEYEFSDTYEFGVVTKTSIKAGTLVNTGDNIVLYISRGKETKETTVPKILGLTMQKANELLSLNALKPGNVTYAYSKEYKEGEVMTQSVKEGKIVPSLTVVDYVISKGEEPKKTVIKYGGSIPIAYMEDNIAKKVAQYKDVVKTEIKVVLKQTGYSNKVVMTDIDYDKYAEDEIKFYGVDGVTKGQIVVYVRVTYKDPTASSASTEKTTEAEKTTVAEKTTAAEKTTEATTKASVATKTTEYMEVYSANVTLAKTEVEVE